MKTIKELSESSKWSKQTTGYFNALKHVLKLIDERIEELEAELIRFSIGGWPGRMAFRCRAKINELKELKAKISG